jgi:aminopeptidase N
LELHAGVARPAHFDPLHLHSAFEDHRHANNWSEKNIQAIGPLKTMYSFPAKIADICLVKLQIDVMRSWCMNNERIIINLYSIRPDACNEPQINVMVLRLYIFLSVLFLFSNLQLAGQDHHERLRAFDVLSYRFEIDLNDSTDMIRCEAFVEVLLKEKTDRFYLDLASSDSDGKGMVVEEILENGKRVSFQHHADSIILNVAQVEQGAVLSYHIRYKGIPADGLVIAENKFGDRTFFGDNWPNRARQWLPVVDHPSDKAAVEFMVHAPAHYDVVANGMNQAVVREHDRLLSHWKTNVPLSTKLMVIGVSPFAISEFESSSGIPVSSWVYPQNREAGFYDYRIALRPLEFFESYIGSYPYTKLANVQSKTVYGGMENASCVFYSEGTVTGNQEHEVLFAHEIAHQWFGDAVSEMNWYHIWLSEGFATYLSYIYLESVHGRDVFLTHLLASKSQVLRYSKWRLAPTIDTTLPVTDKLLNPNTYEKGAWTLHMLRRELGDELFQQCIRTFYEEYKHSNALTEDFQEVVETLAGAEFNDFFHQWLYEPGHPVLSSRSDHKNGQLCLTIRQHQEQHCFTFPLDVIIKDGKGNKIITTLAISKKEQSFTFPVAWQPKQIILDPENWLLFENYNSP